MINYTLQILKNPFYFEQIPPDAMTKELALLAISVNPHCIRVIPKEYQTNLVCIEALTKDPLVLQWIKQPIQQYYDFVLDNLPYINHDEIFSLLLKIIPAVNMTSMYGSNVAQLACLIGTLSKNILESFVLHIPTNFWTTLLLCDILSRINGSNNSLHCFLDLLQQHGVTMSISVKKRFPFPYIKKLTNGFEFTEELAIKYIKYNYHLPDDIKLKWASCLNLTFTDVYKSRNRILALKMCKKPSYKIIMLCAIENPWKTINCCLKRGILTGELLSNIIDTDSANEKLSYHSCFCRSVAIYDIASTVDKIIELSQVIPIKNLEQLRKIILTGEQMAVIYKSKIFYDWLLENNQFVVVHKKVIVRDSKPKRNYESFNWTLEEEIKSLKRDYHRITFEIKNFNLIRFYKINQNDTSTSFTKVRSIILLD